jgi:hypothetical protein
MTTAIYLRSEPMNTLNLVNYIRHGMIFNNLAQYELFDLIVYQQFDNTELTPPE